MTWALCIIIAISGPARATAAIARMGVTGVTWKPLALAVIWAAAPAAMAPTSAAAKVWPLAPLTAIIHVMTPAARAAAASDAPKAAARFSPVPESSSGAPVGPVVRGAAPGVVVAVVVGAGCWARWAART